jgi:hypothetical protein
MLHAGGEYVDSFSGHTSQLKEAVRCHPIVWALVAELQAILHGPLVANARGNPVHLRQRVWHEGDAEICVFKLPDDLTVELGEASEDTLLRDGAFRVGNHEFVGLGHAYTNVSIVVHQNTTRNE